jgi:hypothetical protein
MTLVAVIRIGLEGAFLAKLVPGLTTCSCNGCCACNFEADLCLAAAVPCFLKTWEDFPAPTAGSDLLFEYARSREGWMRESSLSLPSSLSEFDDELDETSSMIHPLVVTGNDVLVGELAESREVEVCVEERI